MAQYRVVIADDDESFRALIRMKLEREEGFEIVAEAEDAATAGKLAAEHQPDFVTLDLHMPGMTGLDVIPFVREHSPRTRIVVVSGTYLEDLDPDVLAAGADGFLTKDQVMLELVPELRSFGDGR